MSTRILRPALVALVALMTIVAPGRAAAQAYTVIVNASNGTASLSRDEAAMMFLKQKLTWADGQTVAPVDLPKANSARAAFTEKVLGRSVSAVTSYWQGQIFAGGAQPPVEKPSDADIIAFVRANPNAIGYVSAGAALGDGVKPVDVK